MRENLSMWSIDADSLQQIRQFALPAALDLNYLPKRVDDYYLSLTGEFFDHLSSAYGDRLEWARLGNALAQAGEVATGDRSKSAGIDVNEASLYAATAFYCGGYPASAYLTLRQVASSALPESHRDALELLSRRPNPVSERVQRLISALRIGDLAAIDAELGRASEDVPIALSIGPDEWVGARLFQEVLRRFAVANVRAVLPNGGSAFWNPLVQSMLRRSPPVWEFFPSQVEAIRLGLLGTDASYSIQMPTGAGKTALTETLLYSHLATNSNDVAILLVPYRSLASELRRSVVRRLTQMGFPSRSIYGGTVPTGDEVRGLQETRAVVATPEALSGVLSVDPSFSNRIGLVVVDEGHLLDQSSRGVALELLLARFQTRSNGAPKFVFVSAIVPNIEEINTWLGGTDATIARSDYSPALAEFALLNDPGSPSEKQFALQFHPHDPQLTFSIEAFLSTDDFRFRNRKTNRQNTYAFSSVKTRAVATARKSLEMGAVAIFVATKRGSQGAIGLVDELLRQLEYPLRLPTPRQYVTSEVKLQEAAEYCALEYGSGWSGTRALDAGVVLHHGDVPQECREVSEGLVRDGTVRLAICTSTLAEGVNLPIRTLVLYSVSRRTATGAAENLLARDIKNLVGRAGRAGISTRGLVICANPSQWPLILPVVLQQPGERVEGALLRLLRSLNRALARTDLPLTNDLLEGEPLFDSLIDGIDSCLIDLVAEEAGVEELVRIARDISGRTFAATQAEPEILALSGEVFELRARRIADINESGRLSWIRDTGTRPRLVESIETSLLPKISQWSEIDSPTNPVLVAALVTWAWELPSVRRALDTAYRGNVPSPTVFTSLVSDWIAGLPFADIALNANLDIDSVLGIHAGVISYQLQTAVEQGTNYLQQLLNAQDLELAPAVVAFPDHLRFGVPSPTGRVLASVGVRHRRAAVTLGQSPELEDLIGQEPDVIVAAARSLIADRERWLPAMGQLVFKNTATDLEVPLDGTQSY